MSVTLPPGKTIADYPETVVYDSDLSLGARGLLFILLMFVGAGPITQEDLLMQMPEGKDALRSRLKELVEHGYLVIERNQDSSGRFTGATYRVTEYCWADAWAA